MQLKEKPELNQINEQSKFLAKTYQPNRPIKEPKSVAKVDRTNLQPIKEPQSVAKVDIQPKEKLDLNQINQKLEFLAKTYRQDLQPIEEPKSVPTTYQPYLPVIKEPESVTTTLLKIMFIYLPLAAIKLFFALIILVILAAIALPELGRCRPYKAMQTEAKLYVSSMNKGQQAKYAENGAFSNSITALGLGIKTQTPNYNYSAIATKNTAFSYGVSRSNNLRSYVGAVFLVPDSQAAKNKKTTVSILCETTSPGKTQPPNPIFQNGDFACSHGTVAVTR